jgi:hypothetical protein
VPSAIGVTQIPFLRADTELARRARLQGRADASEEQLRTFRTRLAENVVEIRLVAPAYLRRVHDQHETSVGTSSPDRPLRLSPCGRASSVII